MITRLSRWFSYASGVALLIMGLLGTLDILGTNILGWPLPGTFEVTSTLMVSSIFLGLAWTEARGRHVRVEILLALLPQRLRRWFDAFASFCLAVFFGFIVWFGALSFWRSVDTHEFAQGLIEVPLWPSRLILTLGALLLTLQALRSARLLLAGKSRDSDTATGAHHGDSQWTP